MPGADRSSSGLQATLEAAPTAKARAEGGKKIKGVKQEGPELMQKLKSVKGGAKDAIGD